MLIFDSFLDQLWQIGKQRDVPNITPSNARFLSEFVQKHSLRNLLEIGTANWLSTIVFARSISPFGGKVTTIEFSTPSYHESVENIRKAGVAPYIEQHYGNAFDILPTLPAKSYDCIFIDAEKKSTVRFLGLSLPLLVSWGVIIIDDVIKFRVKMEGLDAFLHDHKLSFELHHTDEDDGVMVIRR